MAGRRVPFSHPFFSQDPDEFWSRRYQGMPPEFWSSAGFTGPSGQGPPSGFPAGTQVQSQRTHHSRQVVSGSGDFPSSSQMFEQYFGGDPFPSAGGAVTKGEKAVSPTTQFYIRRPGFQRQNSGLSEVKCDEGTFKVSLDVQQFTPDELDVRVVDGDILVHAKHEQREDEQGFVSREFTRRYKLPDDVDPETVKSSLSQEGVLCVEAPRKQAKAIEGQKVPIKFEAKPVEGGEAGASAAASEEAKK